MAAVAVYLAHEACCDGSALVVNAGRILVEPGLLLDALSYDDVRSRFAAAAAHGDGGRFEK